MSPLEAKVAEIVTATNELDAGLSLLIDHARKDSEDVGAHRADRDVDAPSRARPYYRYLQAHRGGLRVAGDEG